MLTDAKALLAALTKAFPPGKQCHHNLTIVEGRLTLTLFLKGRWQSFYFEGKDEEKPVSLVVKEIKGLVKDLGKKIAADKKKA